MSIFSSDTRKLQDEYFAANRRAADAHARYLQAVTPELGNYLKEVITRLAPEAKCVEIDYEDRDGITVTTFSGTGLTPDREYEEGDDLYDALMLVFDEIEDVHGDPDTEKAEIFVRSL